MIHFIHRALGQNLLARPCSGDYGRLHYDHGYGHNFSSGYGYNFSSGYGYVTVTVAVTATVAVRVRVLLRTSSSSYNIMGNARCALSMEVSGAVCT